uniref:Reverse transcriptase domain-containing protein n=1 Tax=Tanacetum cinerariifolium TaxID=118510 RepID=A0A6L2M081_TANCI|nr:hypothetical protein [Tanacetum cinerariifolium]
MIEFKSRVERGEASTSSTKQPVKEVEEVNVHDKSRDQESVVHKDNDMMLKNKFTVLNDDVENGGASVYEPSHNNIVNTSDSEDVDEEIFIEDDRRKQVDSVGDSNLVRLCSSVFRHWEWTSNGVTCTKGSRIIVGWNQNELYVRNKPWCLMGDFNAALFLDDLAAGSSNIDIFIREFKSCVENIEVIDIQQARLKFTWNQKPKGKDGILKKLDRVLTNLEFNDLFQEVFLRQKAKIDWLREGDSNSAYFHKVVKIHVGRIRIDVVSNSDGVLFENDHYEAFLGHHGTVSVLNVTDLFVTSLDVNNANDMIRMVSDTEIKNAMFSMGNEKSPGLDGFTDAFFKKLGILLERIKIIANRIKSNLMVLISPNQSAFVPGRSIADNILLTQEIMHNYHLNHGTLRCAFKVDIQKAYDTVDWSFLRMILVGFRFHERMVGWIMKCVTTTSFSICVNGSLHGYFKGKRGLRQGDPLSPYLFTLVMEILTLIIKRRVRESDVFAFHCYCSKLDLVNLCFTDDLFLFAYGNTNSARVIMESLEEFKIMSGLVPSLPKSSLPVKYLGVPLVSSRLIYKDCKELIEKVQRRVDDWKNKSLLNAGRLQLVNSVIDYEGFSVVPVVCLPKDEGGLGIYRLDTFNKALMTTHIWKLLTRKESLWVQWIHAYKLWGRSFWDVPYRGNMSWGWRNILKLRPLIRHFIWHKTGDGSGTLVWFDRWCELSPLAAIITSRDIFREGFSSNSKVCDLMHNGGFLWPPCWSSKKTRSALEMIKAWNISKSVLF